MNSRNQACEFYSKPQTCYQHAQFYIYTVEYYSVMEKNKIMPFVGTWMDLEIIILNGVNHTEEDALYDIPYM